MSKLIVPINSVLQISSDYALVDAEFFGDKQYAPNSVIKLVDDAIEKVANSKQGMDNVVPADILKVILNDDSSDKINLVTDNLLYLELIIESRLTFKAISIKGNPDIPISVKSVLRSYVLKELLLGVPSEKIIDPIIKSDDVYQLSNILSSDSLTNDVVLSASNWIINHNELSSEFIMSNLVELDPSTEYVITVPGIDNYVFTRDNDSIVPSKYESGNKNQLFSGNYVLTHFPELGGLTISKDDYDSTSSDNELSSLLSSLLTGSSEDSNTSNEDEDDDKIGKVAKELSKVVSVVEDNSYSNAISYMDSINKSGINESSLISQDTLDMYNNDNLKFKRLLYNITNNYR